MTSFEDSLSKFEKEIDKIPTKTTGSFTRTVGFNADQESKSVPINISMAVSVSPDQTGKSPKSIKMQETNKIQEKKRKKRKTTTKNIIK